MAKLAFGSKVAARTRTAVQILDTAELVAKYEEQGGLARDLERVRDAGLEAEAANLGQSQSKTGGKSATVEVLTTFAAIQKEYSSIMAVVRMVRAELARGGEAALVGPVDAIIKIEAEVGVRTYEEAGGKKRRKRRLKSQEALRAEIAKDAGALLALTDIHPALAERRVAPSRLEALRDEAEKLSGLLGSRASAKGAAKAATKVEHKAVKRQREAWGACYPLLAALARQDERVRSLLAEAGR